jgi:cytochrome c
MRKVMTSRANTKFPLFGILPLIFSFHAFADEPIDADAAIKLARSQSCLRCHAVSKRKEGPSYADVAKRYKEDKDAEIIIFQEITQSPRMRMSDGHKEAHRAVQNTSKEQIMNLVRWILAQ